MTIEEISKQEFEAVLKIKEADTINLISDGAVRESKLDNEKYYFILANYSQLLSKYNKNELYVK